MLQSRISSAFEAVGLSPLVFVTSALREDPWFCSCGHFAGVANSAACKHPFGTGDQLQLFQRKCYVVSAVEESGAKTVEFNTAKPSVHLFYPV